MDVNTLMDVLKALAGKPPYVVLMGVAGCLAVGAVLWFASGYFGEKGRQAAKEVAPSGSAALPRRRAAHPGATEPHREISSDVTFRDGAQAAVVLNVVYQLADAYAATYASNDAVGIFKSVVDAISRAQLGKRSIVEAEAQRRELGEMIREDVNQAVRQYGIVIRSLRIGAIKRRR